MSSRAQEDLAARTKRFALAVVQLCIALPRSITAEANELISILVSVVKRVKGA